VKNLKKKYSSTGKVSLGLVALMATLSGVVPASFAAPLSSLKGEGSNAKSVIVHVKPGQLADVTEALIKRGARIDRSLATIDSLVITIAAEAQSSVAAIAGVDSVVDDLILQPTSAPSTVSPAAVVATTIPATAPANLPVASLAVTTSTPTSTVPSTAPAPTSTAAPATSAVPSTTVPSTAVPSTAVPATKAPEVVITSSSLSAVIAPAITSTTAAPSPNKPTAPVVSSTSSSVPPETVTKTTEPDKAAAKASEEKAKADKTKADKEKSDKEKQKSEKEKSDKDKSDKEKSDKDKADKDKSDKDKADKESTDAGSLESIARVTGARDLWKKGYTGKGVDVALIDSGIAPVPGAPTIVNGADLSLDSGFNHLRFLDGYGHGTHMAGIIAGKDAGVDRPEKAKGAFVGIAPGSRVVNVKVGAIDGTVHTSQVIAGLDWIIQNRSANGMNIRVVNLSYGAPTTTNWKLDPLAWAAEVAWNRGILVVAAAGNEGAGYELASPAYSPRILAVGATEIENVRGGRSDYAIASFSSSGTRRRPDLYVPGAHVASLRVKNSFVDTFLAKANVNDQLTRASGTSQAAAVTSGLAALLFEAFPQANAEQIKALLTSTADKERGRKDAVTGIETSLDLGDALKQGLRKLPAVAPIDPLAECGLTICRGIGDGSDPFVNWALASWNGVTWLMNQWSANQWSANQWSGSQWSANQWSANQWSANQWSANQWSANQWSGNQWSANQWSANQWSANQWSANQWSANQWSANQWSANQWSANQWSANQWSANQWSANQWSGEAWLSAWGL
jgi:serine protease AprX